MFKNLIYRLLLPVYMMASKLLNIPVEEFQRKYIRANNFAVYKKYFHVFEPEQILMLLPHCLQYSLCKYRITFDQDNCVRCGQCDIAELLKLRDKYGVHMAIATGGTLARKIIKDIKPHFILAVACEQDLSLGIYDVNSIPVYGILNERPEGPCINTRVPLEKIEESLRNFIKNA